MFGFMRGDAILLPGGERLRVCADVRKNMKTLTAAVERMRGAAREWKQTGVGREAFFDGYTELLTVAMGKEQAERALRGFGSREMLCVGLEPWVRKCLLRRMQEASASVLARRKREIRRWKV